MLLRVGDDVDLHQNSQILAGDGIDIYGDCRRGGAARRPTATPATAPRWCCAAASSPAASARASPAAARSARTHRRRRRRALHLTEIWGYDDIDHIQFGDPTGIPTDGRREDRLRRPGLHLPRLEDDRPRQRPARSPAATPPTTRRSPTARTCSPSTTCSPPTCSPRRPSSRRRNGYDRRTAGHSLTLDGQADTDYYRIYTTGSRFSERNYVINVLDTGAENDGVDELDIYGRDNDDPTYNGYEPGTDDPQPERRPVPAAGREVHRHRRHLRRGRRRSRRTCSLADRGRRPAGDGRAAARRRRRLPQP